MGQKSKQNRAAARAAKVSKTTQASVRAGFRTTQQKVEDEAPKIVMASAGHRISRNVTGRTDCGLVPSGWAYAAPEAITCGACLSEEEK